MVLVCFVLHLLAITFSHLCLFTILFIVTTGKFTYDHFFSSYSQSLSTSTVRSLSSRTEFYNLPPQPLRKAPENYFKRSTLVIIIFLIKNFYCSPLRVSFTFLALKSELSHNLKYCCLKPYSRSARKIFWSNLSPFPPPLTYWLVTLPFGFLLTLV